MMNKHTAVLALALAATTTGAPAQTPPILSTWILNQNGQMASQYYDNAAMGQPPSIVFLQNTDSADALRVCYDASTVWVRSHGMTANMGPWLNPGAATAQGYAHKFPRNPTVPTVKVASPTGGEIGMLVNGVPIYGLTNANSWTGTTNGFPQQGGQGIWNVEVGLAEGLVLDTVLGAHPQQQGAYHSHTTPYRLYKNLPPTQHSPIVGWSFDGYPVYGPYGYADPMSNTSSIIRMSTGYSLRNITERTTLPNGNTASQAGPAVSTQYPLGTYVEDYEWLATNGGTLDQYNGRICVTPEFPQGTYAYFVTMDAAGAAEFPYYIGLQYYGQPLTENFPQGPNGNGLSIPATGLTCLEAATSVGLSPQPDALRVFPNPSTDGTITLANLEGYDYIVVMDALGRKVSETAVSGIAQCMVLSSPGIYYVRCEGSGGHVVRQIMVR